MGTHLRDRPKWDYRHKFGGRKEYLAKQIRNGTSCILNIQKRQRDDQTTYLPYSTYKFLVIVQQGLHISVIQAKIDLLDIKYVINLKEEKLLADSGIICQ